MESTIKDHIKRLPKEEIKRRRLGKDFSVKPLQS